VLTTQFNLTHEGQELTAFRFRLDELAQVVSGSVHNLQRGLRNADR
jgi:hypothetical protein